MAAQVQEQMRGKVCLVTGATSGIGQATALGLARQGATVVMVARNQAKGETARQEVQAASGNPAVDLLLADLSAQASVHQLAEAFAARYAHLHVLINNAGVILFRRHETVDGVEMTFAVNHLAPFLLTHLLLGQLKAAAPACVVNVASDAHTSGRIALDDLQLRRGYNLWRAYAQSKLALIMCSYEFARRLAGTGITVNCVHPGFVGTNMGMNNVGPRVQAVVRPVLARLGTTPEQGARTSLYVATSPDVAQITGKYFENCRPVPSAPRSYDEAMQRHLWEVSARLVHLPDPGDAAGV